ncbi:erythromycin esterase family protein [Streptomyces sp. NPDC003042]
MSSATLDRHAGIRADALPLDTGRSFDPLLERIGDARFVLLGEASHGTAEYYRRRGRWLRRHNDALPAHRRVGFFGLDVHSLWESLHAVRDYLTEHAPDQADHARQAYLCFEPYARDPQSPPACDTGRIRKE